MSELIVTIADNESVYLNDEQMTFEAADAVLKNYTPQQREALSGVTVEGDKSVSYEAMVRCLDLLRRNGFEQIGLEMRTEP